MLERRRAPRTQIFKSAQVTFNVTLHGCIVRDISTLGARLAFISTAGIPDNLSLTFDAAHTLRPCRVVWRTDRAMGVEFQAASFRSAA